MIGSDITGFLAELQTGIRDLLYKESNIPIESQDVELMDYIDECIYTGMAKTHGLLYRFIEEGRYPEPVPIAIYAVFYPETSHEVTFTGCDAYRRVKEFLPERDAAYLARICGS